MSGECVKVMVRCRPMNKMEVAKNCGWCVQVDTKSNQIQLKSEKDNDESKVFSFDYVFPPDILQQTVYENSAFPLVESVVEGYNGTIFAYGQTGCGKTHSMLGKPNDEVEKGIIPRTFSHIINIVESANDKNFLIRCSYIEIYNEEIRDLLGKDTKAKMELKESPDKGVFVKDLTMTVVKSVAEMEKWMNIGTESRSVGATAMNKDSSRSHSLFTLYIECSYKVEGDSEDHITAGKLNLVDLAGSERQSKTNATGDRLKEATKINLSLSALGNVISALVDGKSMHVPYRDSKLTRMLQDSLGGNTKTIMIAAVSPADYNYDETLSTLRYASRAKNIKNKPIVNQDPKDALLKEYADEIRKLKELLQNQGMGSNPLQGNMPVQQQQQQHQQQGNNNSSSNNNNNNQQANGSNSDNKKSEKEMKKLKEKNDALHAQRQQMEDELKQKDEQYVEQVKEKERIQELLKQFETKMMVGGTADQEKKKKISQMRQKLKKQMDEHNRIQDEMQRKDEEVLSLENKYSSLQEELDATKKLVKKLRSKYKQAIADIKDLEGEHEFSKEDLLDTIRYHQRETKIYQAICANILAQDDIEFIKQQGEWSDDYANYTLPPFTLKNKKLTFIKGSSKQAHETMENEKQMREIEFVKGAHRGQNQNSSSHASNGFDRTFYGGFDDDEGSAKQTSSRYGNRNGRAKQTQQSQQQQQLQQQQMTSFQNEDFDGSTCKYDTTSSLSNLQENHKEKHRNKSPQKKDKKSNGQSDKNRVPHNVALDPIENRSNVQKMTHLSEAQTYSEQSAQDRRISAKNIQLQPLVGIQRQNITQSLAALPNKSGAHGGGGGGDQFEFKSNKVKLDKLHAR